MSSGNKYFIIIKRTAFEPVQWHPTYKNLIIEGVDEAGNKRVHQQLAKFTCTIESDPVEWGRELVSAVNRFIVDNCINYDEDDLYDKIITALFPIGEYKPQ